MKNLFVSFIWEEENINPPISHGNICIPSPSKIENKDDIISLQEYIEMCYGLRNVIVNNWRRME